VGEASLKGHLLVAAPMLVDENFYRTVVLVLEHNAEGAAGLILNRPSQTPLGGPLEAWAPLAAAPGVVFAGGPVQPEAAVCIATPSASSGPVEGFNPLTERLGVVDLGRPPGEIAAGVHRIRVFAGYSGWGEGQLEHELEEGAWFVVDADAQDALSPVPERLWRFVLRRQGGKLAMVANFPPHPSMN
jgi:putative transcriptional regulator